MGVDSTVCTDGVSCASAAQQAAIGQKIQIAVLQQLQQSQQAAGAAAVALIQAAANVGKSLDKGAAFDASA